MRRWLVGVVGMGLLSGCAAHRSESARSESARGGAGTPGRVAGAPSRDYLEEGIASYYAERYNGRATSSGEKLDATKLTAAHPSLPFGTCLRVVNMENQRSVEVRVNDRGPYGKGRVVDVSLAAAQRLGLVEQGLARVRLYRCDGRTSQGPGPSPGDAAFGVPFESRPG